MSRIGSPVLIICSNKQISLTFPLLVPPSRGIAGKKKKLKNATRLGAQEIAGGSRVRRVGGVSEVWGWREESEPEKDEIFRGNRESPRKVVGSEGGEAGCYSGVFSARAGEHAEQRQRLCNNTGRRETRRERARVIREQRSSEDLVKEKRKVRPGGGVKKGVWNFITLAGGS